MLSNQEIHAANLKQDFRNFVALVKEFEKALPQDTLVGAVVDGIIFQLEKLSLTKSGYLLYCGRSLDGLPVRHIRPQDSPLLSLIALPRPAEEKEKPRNPIGFEIL